MANYLNKRDSLVPNIQELDSSVNNKQLSNFIAYLCMFHSVTFLAGVGMIFLDCIVLFEILFICNVEKNNVTSSYISYSKME